MLAEVGDLWSSTGPGPPGLHLCGFFGCEIFSWLSCSTLPNQLPPSYGYAPTLPTFLPVTRQSPFAIIYQLLVHFPSYVSVHPLSLIASTLFSPPVSVSHLGKFGQTVLLVCAAGWIRWENGRNKKAGLTSVPTCAKPLEDG